MAQSAAAQAATTEEREIVISRVFAAPRAMVWAAVADPWQVGQWWGPQGFTTTITEMDLRAGGKWKLVMHGPDGTNYPNEMTFTEVVPLERIALDLVGGREGAEPVRISKVMTFTDEDGGTRFTITLIYPTSEAREKNVREFGAIEGGKQTLARLDAFLHERAANPLEKLAGGPAATHELRITRSFNAPRELVWQAWTTPELALQWSGPRQFPAFHVERGEKPGDHWRIGLRGKRPGTDIEAEMWQGGVLKEIDPPKKLVYTFSWDDRTKVGLPAEGNETLITVRLEEHDGKTTMHFLQEFFATAAERDGHNGGWSSAFERLVELVEAKAAKEAR
jgi:uncharacterized protein YndB with AHSA1/START domain